jgi:hypothetical protein
MLCLVRWSLRASPIAALLVACSSTSIPLTAADASTADAETADTFAAEAAADVIVDADAGASCPLPGRLGSDLCETCLKARCCDVIVACNADPDCHVILSCMQACLLKPNLAACIQKCVNDTPAGADKFRAFESCAAADEPTGCSIDCSQ